MRTDLKRCFTSAILAMTCVAPSVAQDVALDDRFTYQGELRENGAVFDGTADLQFSIFDQPAVGNQIGATYSATNVAVSRGVFEVRIPFAPDTFGGDVLTIDTLSTIDVNGALLLDGNSSHVTDSNDLYVTDNLEVGETAWADAFMSRANFYGFVGWSRIRSCETMSPRGINPQDSMPSIKASRMGTLA